MDTMNRKNPMHANEPNDLSRLVRIKLDRPGSKQFRFDPAFKPPTDAGAAEPRPESGRLMELVRKAIRSSDRERRSSVRHDVVDRDIWVGWWFDDEFGAVEGRVVNLSRTGVKLILGHRPPRQQPLWLYKDVDGVLTCARTDLVGLTPAPDGGFTVRVRFVVPCPTSLVQAVVCGQAKPARRKTQPK